MCHVKIDLAAVREVNVCLVCASVNQVTLEQTVKQVRVASCLCGNTDHNYNQTQCYIYVLVVILPCSTVSCYQRDTSSCDDGALAIVACHNLDMSGMSLSWSCLSLLNKVGVLHYHSYHSS